MIRRALHLTYKTARRIAVAVVGATVLLLGVVMLVTPGPAFVVIPLGLTILSIEFAWARNWLRRVRERLSRTNQEGRIQRADRMRESATGVREKKKKAPEN